MMKRHLSAILLFCFCNLLSAQTIKTKVLVVGGGAAGTGAAIQSALSGVETLLIEKGSRLGTDIGPIDTAAKLGLQKKLVERYTRSQKLIVSHLDPALIPVVLKNWTDSLNKLTVMLNTGINTIEKSGKRWEVRLQNGRKVRAEVLVDASEDGLAALKAGAEKDADGFKRAVGWQAINPDNLYSSNLYRTCVVADTAGFALIPLAALISSNTENLVFAGLEGQNKTLATGQAAGALAAYCGFFSTTTKSISIRDIQGELLKFESWLIPFADIKRNDRHFSALQRIGATGILKGEAGNHALWFMPDGGVSSAEIRPVMKAYYMRSQIWSPGKEIDKMTIDDVLSLIKICGARGEELNRDVEKNWKTGFAFSGDFALDKPVSRREFAVLLDTYLQPFSIRINQDGKIKN